MTSLFKNKRQKEEDLTGVKSEIYNLLKKDGQLIIERDFLIKSKP
jgi:hypothetical protein